MPPMEINLFAVLVAAIVNMVVGFIWYSPGVLGKTWMKAIGKTLEQCTEEMKKEANKAYMLSFLGGLVMSFVLAQVSYCMQSTNFFEAMRVGCLVWLGFIATVSLNNYLFEKKSIKLLIINSGYYLVSLICMAIVFALMA